jgi:hypothetical protein
MRHVRHMRLIGAVLVLVLGGVAVGRTQVKNADLGYTLTLPEGFTDFPEGRSQKDVVDCWTEARPISANGAMVLCVQRMRGTLPHEEMRQQDVPATTQVVTFKWKGFDINGLRTVTSQTGKPVFVLVAQVPLRREAVQLVVGGPADQETRAQTLLVATLATLQGETNWLTSSERAGRLGTAAGWWIGIGAALIAVLAWRKRRARAV